MTEGSLRASSDTAEFQDPGPEAMWLVRVGILNKPFSPGQECSPRIITFAPVPPGGRESSQGGELPVSEWGNRGRSSWSFLLQWLPLESPLGAQEGTSAGAVLRPSREAGVLSGSRCRRLRKPWPRPFSLQPDRLGEIRTLTTSFISAASGQNDFTTVFYVLHVRRKYFHKNMH